MTVHRHTRHSRSLLRKYAWSIFSLLIVFVFFGIGFLNHTSHAGSVEVSFTDPSAHGLFIVPASCPSNPGDADAPWGCSGSNPLCPNGALAPNGDINQCPSPLPHGCGAGTLNDQCVPHGCGPGTLNDQCVYCPNGSLAPNNTASQCTCAQGNAAACPNNVLCPDGSVAQNNDQQQCSCAHGNANACTHTTGNCPTGYTLFGGKCVLPSCVIGYTFLGGQCVFTGCPSGYVQQGNQCVAVACGAQYMCVGNQLYYKDSSCSLTFSQSCSYGCAGGACLAAPSATGTLTVLPIIVKRLDRTQVSWGAQNVVVGSCRVTGTNGDVWAGTTGSQTSSPIPAQTTYTLACTGLDDSAFRISKVVNIVPGFCETGAPGCSN